MRDYRIAVIPGDGIGKEVIPEGMRVLDAAARARGCRLRATSTSHGAASTTCEHRRMMPADGLETLRRFDAIFFGAVGDPDVPDHVIAARPAPADAPGLRPVRQPAARVPVDGVPSPLRRATPGAIDMVVYRENTEGEYAPRRRPRRTAGTPDEVAHPDGAVHPPGCERDHARRVRGAAAGRAKMLTSITKSNAQVTAWCCGTRCSRRWRRSTPTSRPSRCWWTRGDGLRAQAGDVRRGGGAATCSATS